MCTAGGCDDVYGGRLPVHVRCLIDECANIGQIPKLEKLVATIRSREISACLVLQAQSQLKAIYKDNADTIIGNMDSSIFLGGKEPTTLKELAAVLGKETIDTYNTGESRGRGYAILVREEFSCLEFIMNRDTINWILKKLNTGGRTWSIYQRKSIKTASTTRW